MDGFGDPFELLGRLARVLDVIPPSVRVIGAVKAAAFDHCEACQDHGYLVALDSGEVVQCPCVGKRAQAVDYLTKEGWREALDVARPGLGTSVRESLGRARETVRETHAIVAGKVVTADYRVLPRPPWEACQRALRDATWASIPIFGRRGGGKTMTALRLAEVIAEHSGYRVEGVNLYSDDMPKWVQPVSADLLVNRMQLLRRALALPEREEELSRRRNAVDQRAAAAAARALEGIKRRIIVIDEASLLDVSPQSPERRAVVAAMTQARHLEWVVIYVGQLMNQLPKTVLTSDVVLIKQPAGDEDSYDRDDPAARALWQAAALAFERIEGDPNWWHPPHDRPEAWVYVKMRYPVLYDGVMPIGLPTFAREAA